MKKLLVTGAGGFLGRSVVRAALEQGYAVRALVRQPTLISAWSTTDDGPILEHGRFEICVGDLRDPSATDDACRDVDAVVHLAACVAGSPQQQFQSTVAGTENLLSAMTNHNVQRLVLASSFYVYDWARARRSLTEDSPLLKSPYHRDGYTISKWWQERICREWQQESNGQLTVLRPGYIWGDAHPLAPRAGFAIAGRFVVVGPWADAALTHVDNCGEYFVRAVDDKAIGVTLNVVDSQRVSNSKIVKRLSQLLLDSSKTPSTPLPSTPSRTPNLQRRIWFPYLCGAAISRLAAVVARLTLGRKYRLPSLLMPALFQARFRPLRIPHRRLSELLGPARWDFEQCLERTLEGIRASQANDPTTNDPTTNGAAADNGAANYGAADDNGPAQSLPKDSLEDTGKSPASEAPTRDATSLDSTEVGIS